MANHRSLLDPTRKKPALDGGRDDAAVDRGGVGGRLGLREVRPRSESSMGGVVSGPVGDSASGVETKRFRIGAVGDVGVGGGCSSFGFGAATYSIVASLSSSTSSLAWFSMSLMTALVSAMSFISHRWSNGNKKEGSLTAAESFRIRKEATVPIRAALDSDPVQNIRGG